MTFDEIDGLDGDKPTWIVPKERMKMAREHRVPLGGAAVAILRAQLAARGKNPFVFPSDLAAQTAQQHGAGDDDAPLGRWRVHCPWLPFVGAVMDG